jgi:hypothetical protein
VPDPFLASADKSSAFLIAEGIFFLTFLGSRDGEFQFRLSSLALLKARVQIVAAANKMESLNEMVDPNEREVGKVNKLMSQPLHRTDHCP